MRDPSFGGYGYRSDESPRSMNLNAPGRSRSAQVITPTPDCLPIPRRNAGGPPGSGGHPAVDGDHLPGEVAGRRASQVGDQVGDVLGVAQPLDRDPLLDL